MFIRLATCRHGLAKRSVRKGKPVRNHHPRCVSGRTSTIVCVLLALPVGLAKAADSAPSSVPSETPPTELAQLAIDVAAALQAEASGDFLTRERLLQQVDASSSYAPAKWHNGKLMLSDGTWACVEESILQSSSDEALTEYERRRSGLTDSLRNHLSLARWCANEGLLPQSQAHLHRVLAFEPNHALARRALGYRRLGSEWMSPEQAMELAKQTAFARNSLSQFGGMVRRVVIGLASEDPKQVQLAVDRLHAIDDPDAVVAVESTLGLVSPVSAELAVEWLSNVDTVEASQALARFSLFHPMPSIRKSATDQLCSRPLHDFVPDMLEMLTAPVSTMIVPVLGRDGTLQGYRQAFAQEQFDHTDFLVFDRQFIRQQPRRARVPLAQAGNLPVQSIERLQENALRDFASGEIAARNAAVRRSNDQVNQRNARVASVISTVAAEEFSPDPQPMWDWWDRYNETEYQAYKPERYERSSLSTWVPRYELESNGPAVASVSSECFVAGTPVVTQRGIRPIEAVAVGDCVLSRHVDSGELAWKPVIRATNRPPEKTRVISVGDETFECTTGHLFWVSGKGWRKASEIGKGDILHAASEPVVVTDMQDGRTVPTYNLEVADFGTYFVGETMVMTHDVLPRSHNRQRVPGERLLTATH